MAASTSYRRLSAYSCILASRRAELLTHPRTDPAEQASQEGEIAATQIALVAIDTILRESPSDQEVVLAPAIAALASESDTALADAQHAAAPADALTWARSSGILHLVGITLRQIAIASGELPAVQP